MNTPSAQDWLIYYAHRFSQAERETRDALEEIYYTTEWGDEDDRPWLFPDDEECGYAPELPDSWEDVLFPYREVTKALIDVMLAMGVLSIGRTPGGAFKILRAPARYSNGRPVIAWTGKDYLQPGDPLYTEPGSYAELGYNRLPVLMAPDEDDNAKLKKAREIWRVHAEVDRKREQKADSVSEEVSASGQ